MARMKDETYEEKYNTYLKEPVDIDVYQIQDRLEALDSGLYTEEDEELILSEIDSISENRLAREFRILQHLKTKNEAEKYEKDYIKTITQDYKSQGKDPGAWAWGIIWAIWIAAIILLGSLTVKAQGTTIWCLVTDFNTQCIYYNLQTCQYNAAHFGGVCVPKQINVGE